MQLTGILAIMIALVSLPGFSQAPPCPSGTLANVLGSSCTIGHLTFNFQNDFQGSVQTVSAANVVTPLPPDAIGFTPVHFDNQEGFLLKVNFFDDANGNGVSFSQHNIHFSYAPQVNGSFEILGENAKLVAGTADGTPASSDGFFVFDGQCYTNKFCTEVQPINQTSASSTLTVPALISTGLPGQQFTTEVDSFAIGGGEATIDSVSLTYTVAPQTPLPPAANLRFKNIDLPGEQTTFAEAINDRGQIVGAFTDFSGVNHGFRTDHDGNDVTVIDFPGAASTFVNGINNREDIVGQYTDAAGVTHGFLLEDGSFSTIDFPNSVFNLPATVNNEGQIVGFYQNADGSIHGYLLQDGNFTTIDDPDAAVTTGPNNTPITQTELFSINDRGDIAGISFDANGFAQSFVLSHKVFQRISVPAAVEGTQIASINDARETVGAFIDINLVNDGFRRRPDGDFSTVDFPGAVNTFASTINNRSRIVGFYTDSTGAFHSFLANPGGHGDDDDAANTASVTAAAAPTAIHRAAGIKQNAAPRSCMGKQPIHLNPATGAMTCGPAQ